MKAEEPTTITIGENTNDRLIHEIEKAFTLQTRYIFRKNKDGKDVKWYYKDTVTEITN